MHGLSVALDKWYKSVLEFRCTLAKMEIEVSIIGLQEYMTVVSPGPTPLHTSCCCGLHLSHTRWDVITEIYSADFPDLPDSKWCKFEQGWLLVSSENDEDNRLSCVQEFHFWGNMPRQGFQECCSRWEKRRKRNGDSSSRRLVADKQIKRDHSLIEIEQFKSWANAMEEQKKFLNTVHTLGWPFNMDTIRMNTLQTIWCNAEMTTNCGNDKNLSPSIWSC